MISKYATPFFLFDLERVCRKYEKLSSAFPGASVYYAVKANNNGQVLLRLMSVGSRFDISSKQEAELMLKMGADPADLVFSAPVKLPSHIRDTYREGVDLFVFDSDEELNKLAVLAPGSRVLVRLAVSNEGSLFPLNVKFGAPPEQTPSLMRRAQELGLTPYGIAFHVGSQCTRKETWREAMELASGVWSILEGEGMPLRCLNIGGGYPIQYIDEVPSIEDIAAEVLQVLRAKFPPGTQLMLEPGRYLVGDAALLVSTVIGQAERGGKNWLFLDVGAFHGLFEALQVKGEFPYRVKTTHSARPEKPYVLSGPTCDPDDTILNEVWLPEVEVGDRLSIFDTGAYTFVYASSFHGFTSPEIHFISSEEMARWDGEERVFESETKPRYDEEKRYHYEYRGQVCEVFYGIKVAPDIWTEQLWGVYSNSMHLEDSIQEQSCYSRESFMMAMTDPDYWKTVMLVDGKPLGLVMSTNNLEKARAAYINPDHIRRLYPEAVEEGRFWYITCVCVSPEVRNLGFFKLMEKSAVDAIRDQNFVLGCDLSDNRLFLLDMLIETGQENDVHLEKKPLGSQSYFALYSPVAERTLTVDGETMNATGSS